MSSKSNPETSVNLFSKVLYQIGKEIENFYLKEYHTNKKTYIYKLYNENKINKKFKGKVPVPPINELLMKKFDLEYFNPKYYFYDNIINKANKNIENNKPYELLKVSKKYFYEAYLYKLLGYNDLKDFLKKNLNNIGKDVVLEQCKILGFKELIAEIEELDKILGTYIFYYLDANGRPRTDLINIQLSDKTNKPILHIRKQKTKKSFISYFSHIEKNFLITFNIGSEHNPLIQIYLDFFHNSFLIASYTTFDEKNKKFENGYLILQKLQIKKKSDKIRYKIPPTYLKYLLIYLNKQRSFDFSPNNFIKNGVKFHKQLFNLFFRTKDEFYYDKLTLFYFGNKTYYAVLQHKNHIFEGVIYDNTKNQKIVLYSNNLINENIVITLTERLDDFNIGSISIISQYKVNIATCLAIRENIPYDIDLVKIYLNGRNYLQTLKTRNRLDILTYGYEIVLKKFFNNNLMFFISGYTNEILIAKITIYENFTFDIFYENKDFKGYITIKNKRIEFTVTVPNRIHIFFNLKNNYLLGIYSGINYENELTNGLAAITKSDDDIKIGRYHIQKDYKDLKQIFSKHKTIYEFFKSPKKYGINTDDPNFLARLSEFFKNNF